MSFGLSTRSFICLVRPCVPGEERTGWLALQYNLYSMKIEELDLSIHRSMDRSIDRSLGGSLVRLLGQFFRVGLFDVG